MQAAKRILLYYRLAGSVQIANDDVNVTNYKLMIDTSQMRGNLVLEIVMKMYDYAYA